jgi:alanyl-tRNA synthetase
LVPKVENLAQKTREQEKDIERLQQKLAAGSGNDLAEQVQDVKGVKLLIARLDGTDTKVLRTTLDKLKDKLGSAVVLLASTRDDKISLVAGVTPDLTTRVKAGDLLSQVANAVGGKGGGRADMAQGGGTDIDALPGALEKVPGWLAETLG